MEDKFVVGSIVKAIMGREKNEIFIILKTQNQYVFLSNGKQRKIVSPKKKNVKHLICLVRETDLANKINVNKITDADIIKTLKDYKSSKKI